MEKYELTKDWISKNGEKVKFGYSLISSKKYDINLLGDVVKILEIVDPENANEENAKVFSAALKLFGQKVVDKFTPGHKQNEKAN